MKQKPEQAGRKRTALRRPHPPVLRANRQISAGSSPPQPPKPWSRTTAVKLAAEVERLAAELKASRSRITELEARIDVDPLTETLNRRGFERELKRSLAYVKRYGVSAALVYIDLDAFKPVNDRHGHAAGDVVLKAVAARLVGGVRASDVVARIGGDEFVLLLWNVDEGEATAKATELEAAIYATPVRWGASTLVVGAAAGVTMIGRLDAPAEVLARADAAMYARKAQRPYLQSEKRAASTTPTARGATLRR